jgi:hypothetical protein
MVVSISIGKRAYSRAGQKGKTSLDYKKPPTMYGYDILPGLTSFPSTQPCEQQKLPNHGAWTKHIHTPPHKPIKPN